MNFRSLHQLCKCYLLLDVNHMDYTCVTGRTRPRRCPPRPRLEVPPEPTKSTVAQKVSHLSLRSRAAVRTASGSSCRSATDRCRSTPRVDPPPQCGTSLYLFFFLGFSSCSGLAFPVSRCVHVWWCLGESVSVPWWPFSCSCGACVGVAALISPGVGVGPVGLFCGSVFWSGFRSWRFFPGWAFDQARYTGRGSRSEGRSLRQLVSLRLVRISVGGPPS